MCMTQITCLHKLQTIKAKFDKGFNKYTYIYSTEIENYKLTVVADKFLNFQSPQENDLSLNSSFI